MKKDDCGCFGGIILGPDGKPECCTSPGKGEEYLNEIVLKAWGDPGKYRIELLTFEEGKPTNWAVYSDAERKNMLKSTASKFKPYVDPLDFDPVVLSNKQFQNGVFQKKDQNERVFRLPDNPMFLASLLKSDPEKLAEVRYKLSEFLIKTNICGM